MSEGTENIVKVIQQNDPFFARRPYLDFQFLRSEALTHIGELSGKIWTDHNAHDPGITILEVLCYALIDLGHRNTLPVQDLLATAQDLPDFSEDDNFFTPLEILTCNPTTITDYRKLLLEVDGVRNAWIAPAVEQEVMLYINYGNGREEPPKLTCIPQPPDPKTQLPSGKVALNGLYSIAIEIEQDKNVTDITNAVRNTLSAHRNLCEDFKDITILCPCEIGVCAEITIAPNADAATVYEAVLKAVKSYIAPEINYYTLKQLLDKGKSIEDIFAGRPYNEESYGFVDTEELDQLPRRNELHLSDVYRLIAAVEGVVAVNNLSFKSDIVLPSPLHPLRLPAAFVAVFSFKKTCIQLRSGQAVQSLDKEKIEKGLSKSNKSKIGRKDLDNPIPKGTFYPELDDYYSIQRDFPLVYGIGEGGLQDAEPLLRKVQALQLKGYLLFYDQLLANFLSQITHLRQLFSLRQESKRDAAERHTYFTQGLDNVPGIDQLLQIYAAKGIPEGSFIAVPVANNAALAQKLQALAVNPRLELILEDGCGVATSGLSHFADTTDSRREMRIQQAIRDAGQGDYSVEIHQDKIGYFFLICFTQVTEWVFISYQRYTSAAQAREAANFAAFLAARLEHYQQTARQNANIAIDYLYDLVYNPMAYGAYLQYLLEDDQLYCERRGAFLDHLLARFSHQFTDYSLLRFGTSELKKQEQVQGIKDKSTFLDHFDDISRNRGRAFNYLKPSWGGENVSGFERRVSLLSGMNDWKRRSLCKFEVGKSYKIELTDLLGHSLCKSIGSYPSKKELHKAVSKLMIQLRNPDNYSELKQQFSNFNEVSIRKRFSEIPVVENIKVTGYHYTLQLRAAGGSIVQQSTKQDYQTEAAALDSLAAFLEEIKAGSQSGLQLKEIGKKSRIYLDVNQLQYKSEPYKSCKWQQNDENGKPVAVAQDAFASEEKALKDFAENGDHSRFITQRKEGFGFQILGTNGEILMDSLEIFANIPEAILHLQDAVAAAKSDKNYFPAGTEDNPKYRILLRGTDGQFIASSPEPHFIGLKTRDAAFKKVRKAMKQLHQPLEFINLPEKFFWRLVNVQNQVTEMVSPQTFDSEADANKDFEKKIKEINKLPESYVAQQVYSITSVSEPAQYRFVYHLDLKEEKSSASLQSIQEYTSKETAEKAYTAFVRALPGLQFKSVGKNISITDDAEIDVSLTESTTDNAQKVENLLQYMHKRYSEKGIEEDITANWLYRLVDVDNPVAKAENCYGTKDEAENQLSAVCSFIPFHFGCNKQVIQIVCPEGSPNKFHYAICLSDDAGEDYVFLHSYLGYDTWEAAQQAGEENWLQLIEIAAVKENYGAVQAISLEEEYSQAPDPCRNTEPYIAVMPKDFLTRVDGMENAKIKAVELAKRYPIRVVFRKNEKGELQSWYYFQGFDLTLDQVLWKSAKEYDTVEACIAAYQIFIVIISHRNSCRIVCSNGKFCIHLVEILAESTEYFSEADVWGQGTVEITDPCGKKICQYTGVRLFAQAAIYENAYIQTTKGDCYQFMIVDQTYKVAKHTCDYFDKAERDKAMETIRAWASSINCDTYQPGKKEVFPKGDSYCFRLNYETNKVTLEKTLQECACKEAAPYEPEQLDYCGEPYIFESVEYYRCEDAAKEDFKRFCKLLKDANNYHPTSESGIGPYSFLIVDPGKILATHPYSYPDKEGAVQAEARARGHVEDDGMHLLEHILLRPQKNNKEEACNCLLPICPEPACTLTWQEDLDDDDPCAAHDHPPLNYIPGSDPYSFWATVVLPAWHRRFQTADARHVFLEMLHREAPAMIALNVLWLSPRQMCQFEKAFRNWLDWRYCPEVLCEPKGDTLCKLVTLFNELVNDELCLTTRETAGSCGCPEPELAKQDQCVEKIDQLFWKDCPQPAVEKEEYPENRPPSIIG